MRIEKPEYDEYLQGWMQSVYVGDKNISAEIKFPAKPTQRQLRRLMKAWKYEVSLKDFKSLWYKKYDTVKGKFVDLKGDR